jgi:hypothetical protein
MVVDVGITGAITEVVYVSDGGCAGKNVLARCVHTFSELCIVRRTFSFFCQVHLYDVPECVTTTSSSVSTTSDNLKPCMQTAAFPRSIKRWFHARRM